MQRLTISLDDDLAQALDQLQEHGGDSKANLIRRALRAHVRRQRKGERPTEVDLRIWTDLLANREHVILDIAHVRLLFEHAKGAPQEFWDEMYQIGLEHGQQYRDKGLGNVSDVLAVIESANWFHVAPEGDRSWALILIEPSAMPFLRTFLSGLFSQYPGGVEIVEERTKLRVRITGRTTARRGQAEPRAT